MRNEYQFLINDNIRQVLTINPPILIGRQLDELIRKCARTKKGWARLGIAFHPVAESNAWPVIKGQEWDKGDIAPPSGS